MFKTLMASLNVEMVAWLTFWARLDTRYKTCGIVCWAGQRIFITSLLRLVTLRRQRSVRFPLRSIRGSIPWTCLSILSVKPFFSLWSPQLRRPSSTWRAQMAQVWPPSEAGKTLLDTASSFKSTSPWPCHLWLPNAKGAGPQWVHRRPWAPASAPKARWHGTYPPGANGGWSSSVDLPLRGARKILDLGIRAASSGLRKRTTLLASHWGPFLLIGFLKGFLFLEVEKLWIPLPMRS